MYAYLAIETSEISTNLLYSYLSARNLKIKVVDLFIVKLQLGNIILDSRHKSENIAA